MSNLYVDKVASPVVLNEAWQVVRKNRDPWCGDLSIRDMQPDLIRHVGDVSRALLAGRFRFDTMCCRLVSPFWGEKRVLCRCSLRNQLVQQAILLVLNPVAKIELGYIEYSADLVNSKIRELVASGYVWLGMTQISNSADLVNHELLLKLLYKLCGDKPLVALVRDCLLSQPQKFRIDGGGLFGGMILTPFLNELYLHQLDLCLTQKHIPFVRFGDELMVLAREEAGASKALDVVQRQLLKLELVADQTRVVRSSFKYKFVGKRLPNSDGLWESLTGQKAEPEPVGMWQRLINRG